MAVYEVTKTEVEKFIDRHIKDKEEFIEYREDLIDMLICDTNEISEQSKSIDGYDERVWPFEKKEPTQLYIRDSKYHIRIKDIVVDFIENILCGSLLEPMLGWFGMVSEIAVPATVTTQFIFFVKRVVKEYVVKLDNTDFCVYLQIIVHLKEKSDFNINDIQEWMPRIEENDCNMSTSKWQCKYLNSSICYITKDDIENILKRMVAKNIIDYTEDGSYKIKY